jgi:uncharacterized membrane protein YfcA
VAHYQQFKIYKMHELELILLFFTIAAGFASAGFGGGSSYLAVMALFGINMTTMKSTALLCNLIVVIGGTYIFWKNGYLDLKKILPLSIVSIPMAFWGGTIKLSERSFFILLGVSLIIAAILMFLQKNIQNNAAKTPKDSVILSSSIGGAIGFLSGMVGIGGGIFLSPVFNLIKWDTPKNVAATASFFILVNSIAGLAGQLFQNKLSLDWAFAFPLLIAVLIGGQLGSRFSALRLNQAMVRQFTAVLVLYAGVNVLWTHW